MTFFLECIDAKSASNANATDPIATFALIATTAKALVNRTGFSLNPEEQTKIADAIMAWLATQPETEIRGTAMCIVHPDFTSDDAALLIEYMLDQNSKVVAVLNTANTQLPLDENHAVVAMGISDTTQLPFDETPVSIDASETESEIGGNQPFTDTDEIDETEIHISSEWSLSGSHIDSTPLGDCGATLDQYGDHSATTPWQPSGHLADRTVLCTNQEESFEESSVEITDEKDRLAVLDAEFFNAQVWYNPTPTAGQSYWSIKIRAGEIPDDVTTELPMTQYDLHFRSSPRNFRKALGDYFEAGKIDAEFHAYLNDDTSIMNVNTKVALLSQPVAKKFVKIAKGKSTREIRFVDNVYATLQVDGDGNQPIKLTIMHRDHQPVVITDFQSTAGTLTKSGKQRQATSAGWIAKHDPTNAFVDFKLERRAQENHAAENKDLTTYNPVSRLGRWITNLIQPVAIECDENSFQIKSLIRSADILSLENGRQAAEIDALRKENIEIRQALAEIRKCLPVMSQPEAEQSEPEPLAPLHPNPYANAMLNRIMRPNARKGE